MDRCEEIILRFFLEENKAKDGSACPATLIKKKKGIELGELYKAARSLELQGLVKIKKEEIGGDSETNLGFWIELTLLGEDVIKKNL